jgi:hypothetical protein
MPPTCSTWPGPYPRASPNRFHAAGRINFLPAVLAIRKGRKLGTAGSAETAARARAARSEQATKANATTRAVIAEIQRAGHLTPAAIAHELEARGVRTPTGRDRWAPAQVSRLLAAKAGMR